jgi:hypothetical protein
MIEILLLFFYIVVGHKRDKLSLFLATKIEIYYKGHEATSM